MIDGLARALSRVRRVLGQLATGGGKTYIFCGIAARYIKKNPGKRVLILVHREELLDQTRRTAYNEFGLECQPITKGMKYIPPADIYVGMVESTWRRNDKVLHIGLTIVDECHRLEFAKFYTHFDEKMYILGFSATPLSANKKKPLNKYFDEIVCGADIPELIELNNNEPGEGLCQNITWAPKEIVDRNELMVKKGQVDFDLAQMGEKYSRPKYIHNTVEAYKRWANGTKAIVFNVNIFHSNEVVKAFEEAGYPVRQLDSDIIKKNKNLRKQILHWFKVTPGAILCNVGMTTMGFDEPTVETIVVNRATQSMPLWIQMCGRGSRPTQFKSAFTIIDMGGNAVVHGDWCYARDWQGIFYDPPKPGKATAAAAKNCPQCDAIIPAASRRCPYCGYIYEDKDADVEAELYDFVIVTKDIDVKRVMEMNTAKKEFYPFFRIGINLAIEAKKTIPKMNDQYAEFIFLRYIELAREFFKVYNENREKKKKFNKWYQANAKMTLYKELSEAYPDWDKKLYEQSKKEFAVSGTKRPFFVN